MLGLTKHARQESPRLSSNVLPHLPSPLGPEVWVKSKVEDVEALWARYHRYLRVPERRKALLYLPQASALWHRSVTSQPCCLVYRGRFLR